MTLAFFRHFLIPFRKIQIVLLVCSLQCIGATPLSAQQTSPLLEQAIDEYTTSMEEQTRDFRLQRFSRAEQLFQQALANSGSTPIHNSELFVNLGNAALQAEHIGTAIVAYRRALSIDPNHNAARQNLRYARSTLPEWAQVSETTESAETLFFWRSIHSNQSIVFASAVCFVIAAMLFSASIVCQISLMRHLSLLCCGLWIILLLSTLGDSQNAQSVGVITTSECVLRSADSVNSPPRISKPLPNGLEVRVLQKRDRWIEVEFDGQNGWVRTS